MERFLIRFERWYHQYSTYLQRLLVGVVAAFWVGRLAVEHSHTLPPAWARLTAIVVAGAYVIGEAPGLLVTLGILAWMIWNTWTVLATALATITVMMPILAYTLLRLVSSFSRQGWVIARVGTGQLTLLLLSPFLANANIAFVVPLWTGLNWGISGIPTAAAAGILTTIVSTLQGARFWGFLLPGGQALMETTVRSTGGISSEILASLPPGLKDYAGLFLQGFNLSGFDRTRAALQIVGKIGQVVATSVREEIVLQPVSSVVQAVLWAVVSLLVSVLSHGRTSTVSRLFSAVAGAAALGLGYYWAPRCFGVSEEPYWPGGARLFWYYMSVSLAIALLPKVVVTGRFRPTQAQPAPAGVLLPTPVLGDTPLSPANFPQAPVEPQQAQVGQPAEPEPRQPAGPRRRRIEL